METRAGGGAGRGRHGGEEGGAEEFDRAEGRAPRNEVHLVFVRAREKREAFWFAGPEDKRAFLVVILYFQWSFWLNASCLSYTAALGSSLPPTMQISLLALFNYHPTGSQSPWGSTVNSIYCFAFNDVYTQPAEAKLCGSKGSNLRVNLKTNWW